MELDSKSPTGPIETRWARHRFNLKLVNPANKRKHTIIAEGGRGGPAREPAAHHDNRVLAGFAAARALHRGAGRH